jgi:hypothetical protein
LKSILLPILVTCLAGQSLAMKNRHETFPQTCDAVWKTTVAVAKSEQYRIVSISSEDHVLSLVAGGAWAGERIISLSLAPGDEGGCTVTVQSRFSGLAHSDGPDLLVRIRMELFGEQLGHGSKLYEEYRACLDHGSYPDWGGRSKCAEQFQSKADAEKAQKADRSPLWNTK